MPTIARLLVAAFVVAALPHATSAQKSAPDANWRCQVVFRDAAGDAIRSDTAPGSVPWPRPYRDGQQGVDLLHRRRRGCVSRPMALHEGREFAKSAEHTIRPVRGPELCPAVWRDSRVHRHRQPERRVVRGEGTRPGRVEPARLDADSNFTGGIPSDTTSSVFVQPLDACSWQITSYTTEEPTLFEGEFGERTSTRTTPRVMRIWERLGKNVLARGEFPMPFQATVSVIGNRPGCPLP